MRNTAKLMGMNKAHNQVSRRNNNQVTGVETQNPAYEKPHSQANGDEHEAHNQVYRRNNNQVAGVETQDPAEERPHSQANGDEHDDCHNQVYGRQSQVLGVETQDPAEERPHSQANRDEHDDCHSQVYGRHSQVLGVEPQVSTSRRPNNQVTGVEPQISTSRRPNNQVTGVEPQISTSRRPNNQVTGVEPQISTSRRPNNQVTGVEPQVQQRRTNKQMTGREVQSSDSEEFMTQPPCCLPHSCKTNIIFTERLLLRNSSKDNDKSDKNFRKEVKVLEFMNWLKAVFELSALTTAFHLSMGPGFHNNSTKSLESPQTSLGHAVQQQTGKEGKKNLCEEPGGTGRVTYFHLSMGPGFHNNSTKSLESPQTSLGHAVQQQTGKEGKKNLCEEPGGTGRVTYFHSLLVLLVVLLLIGTTSNKVHQFTSTDGLGVITVKPMAAYRGVGENLEFLNDCLATQIETIIQELEKGGRSDPRFLSLINNQKRPQNETIIEKLKIFYSSERPQNETIIEKLETRECSGPRSFILLKNRKEPKNEKELEEDGRSNPRFLDLIKNKKRSKNETIDGELEEGGRSEHRFLILKRNQKELQNQTSMELEKGFAGATLGFWIS